MNLEPLYVNILAGIIKVLVSSSMNIVITVLTLIFAVGTDLLRLDDGLVNPL